MAVPDYGIQAGDEEDIPDYALDDLSDDGVQPEEHKQLVPKPPTYKESLAHILEQQDFPLKYDEDEGPDYAFDEEDRINEILNDMEITDYDNVEKILNEPGMSPTKIRSFLNKVIVTVTLRRKQLKGYKTQVTNAYKRGEIREAQRAVENKRTDDSRLALNQYIKYYETRVKGIKGSGIRKRGCNVMFFNNPQQLLKKLELIIGEVLAGNTSIDMRNMGVAILDTLLKTSAINKAQHAKLYKQYFNPI